MLGKTRRSKAVTCWKHLRHFLGPARDGYAAKPRWLVLNKIDLLPADEVDARCKDIVRRLRWKGPTFRISGVTGEGTQALMQDVMKFLEATRAAQREAEEVS